MKLSTIITAAFLLLAAGCGSGEGIGEADASTTTSATSALSSSSSSAGPADATSSGEDTGEPLSNGAIFNLITPTEPWCLRGDETYTALAWPICWHDDMDTPCPYGFFTGESYTCGSGDQPESLAVVAHQPGWYVLGFSREWHDEDLSMDNRRYLCFTESGDATYTMPLQVTEDDYNNAMEYYTDGPPFDARNDDCRRYCVDYSLGCADL